MSRPPAWKFYGWVVLVLLVVGGLTCVLATHFWLCPWVVGVGGLVYVAAHLEIAREEWDDPPKAFRLRDWW